jgi:uncharacterized RDD family membrane protein YckC
VTPPAFPSPSTLAPPAPTYAGFWIRFVAVIIDAFILFLLGLGVGVVIRLAAGAPAMPHWRMRSDWMDSDFSGIGCAQQCVKFVVWWLYHALFESSASQATPGKQALGLKVTDIYGRRISFGRAAARTLAKILSAITIGIGYVMAAFTLRKQALHDFVAETVVLRGWRGSS